MTETADIITEHNQAKEFQRKLERNGTIGHFLQIIDRNQQVSFFSVLGVVIASELWMSGKFLFAESFISGWGKLLIFLIIWGLVTFLGWAVVKALNYTFDWAHDRERARDLLYAAYNMDSADAACEIACNWDRYGRYIKYCNKYFDMVAIRQSQEEWFHKAANQGHAVAQYRLGNWYASVAAGAVMLARYRKTGCFDAEVVETGRWYPKAEEQGYADTEAVKKAVMWYRKAAEQGYADAQCCLGRCYEEGFGVEKDEAEAVKWYRRAAEGGSTMAQRILAKCYEDGIGVEKDELEASNWSSKAFAQGSLRALT